MTAFDNAKIVKINNKEVESIKTNDEGLIYQRPIIATVTDDTIQLGYKTKQWLITNGNVIVDWGDRTTSIINNPSTPLTHNYTDGKQNHDIVFFGNVTSLGDSCFRNCTGLTSIIIPNNVKSFGNECFQQCSGLTSISIPSSVTSLGGNCFAICSGLTSITIPSSVTSLKNGCFLYCINLNTYQLYWINNNIITYDALTMPNNTNTTFYVPKGQKTNYVNKGYPSAKVIERSS